MPVQVERTNVSLPSGARLMILRDNIDHMEPAKMATVDCSHFAQYARSAKLARTILLHCHPCIVCDLLLACAPTLLHSAMRACEVARAAARGEAPMAEWLALSAFEKTFLNAHFNRAHFSLAYVNRPTVPIHRPLPPTSGHSGANTLALPCSSWLAQGTTLTTVRSNCIFTTCSSIAFSRMRNTRCTRTAWPAGLIYPHIYLDVCPHVPFHPDQVHGYAAPPPGLAIAEMATELRQHNARALSAAMFSMTFWPWLLCCALYSTLLCSGLGLVLA